MKKKSEGARQEKTGGSRRKATGPGQKTIKFMKVKTVAATGLNPGKGRPQALHLKPSGANVMNVEVIVAKGLKKPGKGRPQVHYIGPLES